MDINKETNEHGEKDESRDNSEDNLEILELMITDRKKRVRNYGEIRKTVNELIISEANDQDKFKFFIRLLLKGDVQIIKGFFEQDWEILTTENRDLAINELIGLSVEKGLTKQATVAQTIANKNNEIAAKIIFHILVGNKPNPSEYNYSKIIKDKKDALQIRFFPPKGNWISLTSTDHQILKTLILFFSEFADEIEDFGKGVNIGGAFKFSKWIIDSLQKVEINNDLLTKIEARLYKIINRLPPNAQEELKKLNNKLVDSPVEINENDHITKEKSLETAVTKTPLVDSPNKIPFQNEIVKQKIKTVPVAPHKSESNLKETVHKKDSQKISDLPTPEQLLKEKQNTYSQLSLEIDVLSNLITERDDLLTKQKSLQNKLDSVYDETDKFETKLRNLRKSFDENEATLAKVTNERDKANSIQKQLSEDLADVRKQLENATKSLESERSEFAKSSKQEVGFEIENFKGELKQKLRPIFENKRQTDALPNDETLSEFLRDWFSEIEKVLNKLGINP